MAVMLDCETDCVVKGVVLLCLRDGRKVFRAYLPENDPANYGTVPEVIVSPVENHGTALGD